MAGKTGSGARVLPPNELSKSNKFLLVVVVVVVDVVVVEDVEDVISDSVFDSTRAAFAKSDVVVDSSVVVSVGSNVKEKL